MLCMLLIAGTARADTTWVWRGSASGTWSTAGSPYMIMSDLRIAGRDTLVITPNVQVFFTGHYKFLVEGTLYAIGKEDSGIVFTADTVSNGFGWAGIWLRPGSAPAQFSYCTFEYGRAINSGDDGLGGAIFADGATATLCKSTIRWCRAGSGHGIFARNQSHITLNDCAIRQNGLFTGAGGAVCCRSNSTLTMNETTISENLAMYGGGVVLDGSTGLIEHSRIQKNVAGVYGGGIYCTAANLTMNDSWLLANTSVGGGGLDGRSDCTLEMNRCVVAANSAKRMGADGPGGGLALLGGEQHVNGCTFAGNLGAFGGGIYAGARTFIDDCIFTGHTQGAAIYFAVRGADTRYSCFAMNDSTDVRGPGIPDVFGSIRTVNANRDSCDAYFNLFMNPLFDDSATAPYHLTAGSPCINAGDPSIGRDPDGSLLDMGAFFYSPAAVSDRESGGALPTAFTVAAYPNPFNAVTTIPFELARDGRVSLRIYDLLGREVATLIDDRLSQGMHTVPWNAVREPSGTYLVVLESAGMRSAQKLLLLK